MPVTFAPGPSHLYFTVEDHIKSAFREGIPSISHRSKTFEHTFQSATEGLRALLGIPGGFHIFFTSSATEIWDRSVQNLVEHRCAHFVNGSFSKRYWEIALQLNKQAQKIEAPLGQAFADVQVEAGAELIALTHNETSTGVALPMDFINQFKASHPQALVVVDAVSSLPYPQFDFSKIDSLFFSVQKGFGLPAGLGVWIANEACLTRAEALQKNGVQIGSYHNLPSLYANAKKNQTTETPNVLGIYLLAKVVNDMLQKGIDAIRRETDYKAAVLYQALAKSSVALPFVADVNARSKTVIVANTGDHTTKISEALNRKGMLAGSGYGELKASQLRFANFPTHSKEQYEMLADTIEALT